MHCRGRICYNRAGCERRTGLGTSMQSRRISSSRRRETGRAGGRYTVKLSVTSTGCLSGKRQSTKKAGEVRVDPLGVQTVTLCRLRDIDMGDDSFTI